MSKAWLDWNGEPLLVHVATSLVELFSRVVVAARPDQELPDLPPSCRIVRDRVEDQGPLRGLEAGFDALDMGLSHVMVVGCDQPFVHSDFIQLLYDRIEGAVAAVPRAQGREHPLTALYAMRAREHLAKCLERGERRVGAFVEACCPRYVDEAELETVDPGLRAVVNLNSAEEYSSWLKAGGAPDA